MAANRDETIRLVAPISGLSDDIQAREYDKAMPMMSRDLRFLPKALLVFVVEDSRWEAVVEAIADAARSGNPAGDGLVWTSPVQNVVHNRTGASLERVELT